MFSQLQIIKTKKLPLIIIIFFLISGGIQTIEAGTTAANVSLSQRLSGYPSHTSPANFGRQTSNPGRQATPSPRPTFPQPRESKPSLPPRETPQINQVAAANPQTALLAIYAPGQTPQTGKEETKSSPVTTLKVENYEGTPDKMAAIEKAIFNNPRRNQYLTIKDGQLVVKPGQKLFVDLGNLRAEVVGFKDTTPVLKPFGLNIPGVGLKTPQDPPYEKPIKEGAPLTQFYTIESIDNGSGLREKPLRQFHIPVGGYIEVRDADGNLMRSGVLKPGQILDLERIERLESFLLPAAAVSKNLDSITSRLLLRFTFNNKTRTLDYEIADPRQLVWEGNIGWQLKFKGEPTIPTIERWAAIQLKFHGAVHPVGRPFIHPLAEQKYSFGSVTGIQLRGDEIKIGNDSYDVTLRTLGMRLKLKENGALVEKVLGQGQTFFDPNSQLFRRVEIFQEGGKYKWRFPVESLKE